MTDDMMNLRSLVEKSADADLLPEMTGFAAEKLMEPEVGATGAAYGEKNAFRLAQVVTQSDQLTSPVMRLDHVSIARQGGSLAKARPIRFVQGIGVERFDRRHQRRELGRLSLRDRQQQAWKRRSPKLHHSLGRP